MSYIQFESSRVKEAQRQAIRDSRQKILTEAKEKHDKKLALAERARQRGDDKWILPSVEAKLSGKSKKKKKKDKKERKLKKKRRKSSSESSSDSSKEEGEEWIEKSSSSVTDPLSEPLERDEWMNLSGVFLCSSKEKKPKKQEDKQTCILDKPGQSTRELNLHWRDGGTGLPKNDNDSTLTSKTMNPEWLKKSLQRAKEQAAEENRSLEEIAEERWGSLDVIKSMIEKAEHNYKLAGVSRRHDTSSDSRTHGDSSKSRSRSKERKRHSSGDYKPLDNKRKLRFKRPGDDAGHSTVYSGRSKSSRNNWKKSEVNDEIEPQKSSLKLQSHKIESNEDDSSSEGSASEKLNSPQPVAVISEDELNKLGAKIVKAEIMGDMELAQELKEKLDKAREVKKFVTKPAESKEEDVILTITNSKGMSRPLEPRSRYEEPQSGRRKSKKMETHDKGERVRYFADDDKYSLQEMFQKEKGESSHKDDSMFVKMASKSMDMDELFEQRITRDESDAKQDLRDKMRAIKNHKKMEKSLENCKLCFDSKEMLKHLIVGMGTKVYLSLPSHLSLTPHHCIIAPIYHSPCQTQLDEDIYEELKAFKNSMIKMCAKNKEYPVFFEVAMGLHKYPHMQLECVPMPEDIGAMAPMYFKKALLECEMEWSTNKKLVDLSKKDVKQSIPKGLPYFTVDFGDHGGFAHVIEDEKHFPRNFAQEIIGGMMDLDSSMWRKPRRENFESQRNKVIKFAEKWRKYDFTS
ncbi:CWF19-like protein 2 [Fopius arisanus]|uniref:CWF19-like protein 2 n=1 Tax=Fopius arisanus TaxID=64838 RepID=A0A9R1SWF1_9HYME|nr:PREDICTED: CWF19-like protein 2 [Fopius arisanus]